MSYLSEQQTVLSRSQDDRIRNDRLKYYLNEEIKRIIRGAIAEEKSKQISDRVDEKLKGDIFMSWEKFQQTKMFNKTY